MISGAGKATNSTKAISPNVEKIVKALDNVKAEGGKIEAKALKPTQDLNIIISKESEKINLRVETHVVDKKYGGNGINPQKHMNVDYYNNNKRKTNSHKIIE